MRARIDISEIEAQTKIRAKYLRALENEEWGLLPGPTFVKSFLRTYAEALSIDARPLVDEYRLLYERPDAGHEPIMPSSRRSQSQGPERASAAYRIAVAVIALLIVVLVVLLVLGRKDSKRASPSSSTTTLALHATKPSRICLSEASGGRLLHYRTLAAGESTSSYRAGEFALWSSSANLKLEVDGSPHSLPVAGAYSVTSSGTQAAEPDGRQRACG